MILIFLIIAAALGITSAIAKQKEQVSQRMGVSSRNVVTGRPDFYPTSSFVRGASRSNIIEGGPFIYNPTGGTPGGTSGLGSSAGGGAPPGGAGGNSGSIGGGIGGRGRLLV